MTLSTHHKSPVAISEERRPGITKLALKIAREHPSWSEHRVLCEAKVQWMEQHKRTEQHKKEA